MTGIPISEVARQARVSSRTLRHYDEIGLLRPASISANGYRYCEREQLLRLRLQRILLLRDRERGLGLEVIAQVQALNAEEQLVDRYGEGVRSSFAESRERTAGCTRQQYQDAAYDELEARMAAVLRAGGAVDSDAAFAVLDDHHAAVAASWTPSAEAYTGLGQWYVENPEFRARYDRVDPGLAEFYPDAMAAYAQARMG